MARLWHSNGKSMENAEIMAFSNVVVILCSSQKLISFSDAQYAKKFGKFFGAKNDDLSKFQIT
ncbi:hypothetical protein A4S05_22025 [Nostoc sp. KVJ20]|uniref:hypothetical protein n=1 Tax=Nostoc sp. KVJ20 TaxID=457944 RepID=UPI00083E2F26|nr:hypothetical protein [Nostoc sp. KVJ20]ODH02940.1 hypothetical protein A4S05_22025 [Nostoc sp. KVJ20]